MDEEFAFAIRFAHGEDVDERLLFDGGIRGCFSFWPGGSTRFFMLSTAGKGIFSLCDGLDSLRYIDFVDVIQPGKFAVISATTLFFTISFCPMRGKAAIRLNGYELWLKEYDEQNVKHTTWEFQVGCFFVSENTSILFQASTDGISWVTIVRHVHEQIRNRQKISFPLTEKLYSHFRIMQPCFRGSHKLDLIGFDIHGEFVELMEIESKDETRCLGPKNWTSLSWEHVLCGGSVPTGEISVMERLPFMQRYDFDQRGLLHFLQK